MPKKNVQCQKGYGTSYTVYDAPPDAMFFVPLIDHEEHIAKWLS